MRRVLLFFALLAVFVPSSFAATFIVPPDEWLIDDSPVIVAGTVVAAHARFAEEQNIETVFRIAVDDVLKGTLHDSQIDLVEWGGRMGDRWMVAVGAPHYELGKRYVIFLYPNRRGEWTTQNLTLGRFAFVPSPAGELLVRDEGELRGWDIYGNTVKEPLRRAADFMAFIRDRAQGGRSRLDYAAVGTLSAAPPQRKIGTTDFAGYDFADACNVAVNTWNDDNNSNVNLSISGSPASDDVKAPGDGQDRIIEEDPHGDIPGSFTGSGTVAVAFLSGAGTHTSGGKTYITIVGADIVTQDGFRANGSSQSVFRTAMAHEVGHTLGFRHSNKSADDKSSCAAPLPCASGATSAVMNSSVGALNGNLQAWDRDAVAATYGSGGDASEYTSKFCANSGCTAFTDETGRRDGATGTFRLAEKSTICVPPSITTQPANKTIIIGESASLQVSAGGSGPFAYQWFIGNAGDASQPTGSSSASLSVNPTTTTSYWVRVTGQCGDPVASDTVTVTVNPCPDVTVGTPTATKNANGSYKLDITASSGGSTLSYAWFKGDTPGVGGTPAGSTKSVNVTITSTSSYWVRVTNRCGNNAVSGLVTISPSCTLPAITTQPQDQVIQSGQNATLSIVTSGVVTSIVWYQGNVGNKLITAGSGASISVGPLTETRTYWAAVTNACGEVASRQVTITVAACDVPQITTEPLDQSIANGAAATLVVGTSGNVSTITWYEGLVGDKTTVLGTGESIEVHPQAETSFYWAAVANDCGEVPTRQVVITMTTACIPPSIAQQPQPQFIRQGETATLTAVAEGSATLHYDWYRVDTGGLVHVGDDSPSYTTDALTQTTKFILNVTNACGAAHTDEVTVTVGNGRRRAARH